MLILFKEESIGSTKGSFKAGRDLQVSDVKREVIFIWGTKTQNFFTFQLISEGRGIRLKALSRVISSRF